MYKYKKLVWVLSNFLLTIELRTNKIFKPWLIFCICNLQLPLDDVPVIVAKKPIQSPTSGDAETFSKFFQADGDHDSVAEKIENAQQVSCYYISGLAH